MDFVYILILIIGTVIVCLKLKSFFYQSHKTSNTSTKDEESRIKGQQGEEYIIELLGQTIHGQRYVVNNLILQDKEGKTSQIDHIFINSNGVFVIETKNLSGTIYGDDNRKEWTQVFNYGEQKFDFYNPVLQNRTHIKRLIEATGTSLPIKSIVVFTNNNIETIESQNVYTIEGMICEMNAFFEEKITAVEMKNFFEKLCELKNEQLSNEEHIENINKIFEKTNNGICPRCGGQLVERKGPHGSFCGCSNYPNCKFTMK